MGWRKGAYMGYDVYGNGGRLSINIFWMSHFRSLMERLGMLDLEATTPDGWEPPEAWWGLPKEHPNYRRQCRLEDQSCLGPLIPLYKLSSNDFWLVSPAEITTALEALGRFPEAQVRFAMTWVVHGQEELFRTHATPTSLLTFQDLWGEWIAFLYATAPVGFRVG